MSAELVLLGEILRLASESECSLQEFGSKVSASPRLAAEVVRVSNSALYGMEGKINRLERAVLILGMRTVSDIASAVLVAERMRSLRIGELSGDMLWMHSLRTGVCAQLTARCLSLPLESEAYLAGLLHDLGIPVMHETHKAAYEELLAKSKGQTLVEVEQARFGETHATRLLRAAAEWGFPEMLRECIGYHDSPEQAPEQARTLVELVRAAHLIPEDSEAHWSDLARGESDVEPLVALGLEPDDVEDIRLLLEERMKELAPLFA